jgi:hypothetical protein
MLSQLVWCHLCLTRYLPYIQESASTVNSILVHVREQVWILLGVLVLMLHVTQA